MNLFGAFRRGLSSDLVVLFHVGSASVECGLIYCELNKPARVLYTARAPFPFQRKLDFDRFERAMLSALLEAGMELQTSGLARAREAIAHRVSVSRAYVLYSAPWYVSQMRTVSMTRDTNFTVDEETLRDLIDGEHDRFRGTLTGSGHEQLSGGIATLDMETLQKSLNGYRVTNFTGRSTREARVVLFATAVSSDMQKKVQEVIERLFPDAETDCHAASLAYVHAAGLGSQERALLIEVGGEVTDLALLTRGVIEETASFPVGANALARSTATADGPAGQERVRLSLQGKAAGTSNEPGNPWDKALSEWKAAFLEACSALADGHVLPRRAVLLAEDEWHKPFTETLTSLVAQELTFSAKPFEVVPPREDAPRVTCEADLRCSKRFLLDTEFINSRHST